MHTTNLRIEINIKETLEEHWAAWFEGLTLSYAPDGSTLLRGETRDRPAVHGILERIRDLNLTLISVTVEEQ